MDDLYQILSFQIIQKSVAAINYVPVSFLKIPGIPRICHSPWVVCIIKKQADFVIRITACDPVCVSYVIPVHADNHIIMIIVLPCHLPRIMPAAGNTILSEFSPRRRIYRIPPASPDFLRAGGRRSNLKPILPSSFFLQ